MSFRVSDSPAPQPTIDEHDSFEDESLDAHPMDSKDDSMELEDSIFFEEGGEECELGHKPTTPSPMELIFR